MNVTYVSHDNISYDCLGVIKVSILILREPGGLQWILYLKCGIFSISHQQIGAYKDSNLYFDNNVYTK